MTKADIKLIARLWVGALAVQSEAGFLDEEVGMTEKETMGVVDEACALGLRLLSKHSSVAGMGNLSDIVNYVKELKSK